MGDVLVSLEDRTKVERQKIVDASGETIIEYPQASDKKHVVLPSRQPRVEQLGDGTVITRH